MLTFDSKERRFHADSTGRSIPSPATLPPRLPTFGPMNHHPLLVDIATNRVEVLEAEISPSKLSTGSTGVAVAGNEAFYTSGSRNSFGATKTSTTMKFLKFDIDSGTTTVLDADSPVGFVFFSGD